MFRMIVFFWALVAGEAHAQGLPGEEALTADRAGMIGFLSGPAGRQTTPIHGNLFLPPGAGPAPAMVVMHGSGGTNPGREAHYARVLNQVGIAAFFVDSFTPRGIATTVTDQTRLSYIAQTEDAFNALRVLRGHPRIDGARVGVMGFSRGGIVARFAAMAPWFQAFRRQGLGFAAHVGFYTSCTFAPLERTAGPMLFLLGGEDDYTPARSCVAYAEAMRALGADVRAMVYAAGRHVWDGNGPSGGIVTLANAITSRDCPVIFAIAGGAVEYDGGARLTQAEMRARMAACIGPAAVRVGPDRAVRDQSDRALIEFLRPIFGL